MVNHLPTMRETQVRSLGWEDPLEKEMATHPVFWPGESHGQRILVGYSPWGSQRVRHDQSDLAAAVQRSEGRKDKESI